ncbi:unnamed protein product [Durusdinium trenchii]|uniref:Uncharacterized protein n=1 Tax=Durusdinium trenchii TaxID=1381693 RepID=A0ABP0MMU1_9DINO
MRISTNEFFHLTVVLVAAAQSCSQEQKPVVLLQTATASGRAVGMHSVGSMLRPHAAASSVLAFAERLFGQDPQLLQTQAERAQLLKLDNMQNVKGEDATLAGDTVLLPVIVATSALILACGIVVCLVTYQPKPEYSAEEQEALSSNMQAHSQFLREKQACAC